MMDVNRLRVFRAVVAAGSVSAAATSLGYTPSAVSQHVAALQRETGLALLEKSGRGIRVTAAGRALASHSDEIMASLARLDGAVNDLRAGRTGSLVIGTFASAGEYWLPGVTATVLAEFPDTQWSIVLTDPPATRIQPDLDIVTEDPSADARTRHGYVRMGLTTEPYVVLLHRAHPLAQRDEVGAAELAGERWIRDDVAESACQQITGNAWRAAGFTPRSIIQAADHHGAAGFVAAGLGVCVMPRLPASNPPPGVVTRPVVDPTPRRRIAVYVREAVRDHPAAVRFVELLREAAMSPIGAGVQRPEGDITAQPGAPTTGADSGAAQQPV